MYLIVGLGNPEAEYARTRHNMGVDVVNELADKYRELSKKEENVIFSFFWPLGVKANFEPV